MDVEAWLGGLGLQQYQAAFRDNEIDGAVLRDLTADDLRELGVASVGHRRKLLSAISELSAASDSVMATSSAQLPAPDAAERRQLTVMFCDLVGSTAMSARLDPEDMREIIGAYHRCCAALIERNGGFVAKYMGDGVLAYFGYPQAHEHDAERAVRAGSPSSRPRRSSKPPPARRCRCGSGSPPGWSSSAISSDRGRRRSAASSARRRTSRRGCKAIAEPDSVVIAEGTRKLLGNLFELQDLGAQDLKGIAAPTRAWAALRASSRGKPLRGAARERSHRARRAGGRNRLLLSALGARPRAGEGQVVLLSGEAGIGKSRLTAALLERLAGEPHTRLRYFCSPQHTDSALYPIIGQMERAAGLARDDAPAVETRQARRAAGADLDLDRGRRALCRNAVAAERWTLSRARPGPAAAPAENAGGARFARWRRWRAKIRC